MSKAGACAKRVAKRRLWCKEECQAEDKQKLEVSAGISGSEVPRTFKESKDNSSS